MPKKLLNNAYIDAANLHKGVGTLGWELDYRRFRVWLRDKYHVETAYLFIGLIPGNKDLYTFLQEAGFVLIYKEVTYDGGGKVKGNCDADLVLKVTVDFFRKKYNKAVVVTSDGDYASLVQFLKDEEALHMLISPSNKCSFLLRKLNVRLTYLDTQKSILQRKEKAPDGDKTP